MVLLEGPEVAVPPGGGNHQRLGGEHGVDQIRRHLVERHDLPVHGAVELRVGRILFSSGGSDWICSGSVVSDGSSTVSVVLTAGHCVYDGTDGWSYNFLFMPGFDDDPKRAGEKVLEAIQATWIEEAE